jgi:predicted MPP superfamily phosphohydrolase
MTSFGWLHLTDLHLGMHEQAGLLPTVEDKFFDDLSRLYEESSPWDLVIFTGDLTFKGSADEFKRVDEFLARLWDRLLGLGANPSLVAVPGNHDLTRPDLSKNLAAKLLRNSWDNDEDIRKEFWADPQSLYRKTITDAFENYSRWWENTQFKLPAQAGELSGDFSAILQKDEASLGIVGLNTAFLQLTGDDYKGKLTVDPIQFQKACGENGPAWVKQLNACLLLTHQPPDWLTQDAQTQLESDIGSYFTAHLFGHMHESRYVAQSTGGAPEIREFQATSLFGIEHFENLPESQRRHGYAAGRIELEGEKGRLTFWPRQANRVANQWNFVVDTKEIYIDGEHTTPREFTLKKALLIEEPSAPAVSVQEPSSAIVDNQPLANRWAVMVGVNDYQYFAKLRYCRQDAIDLAGAFRETLEFQHVLEFHEAAGPGFQPTRDSIFQKLADIRQEHELKPIDLLVFYFSGHGINEGGKDYLLPIGARPPDVKRLGIRVKDLVDSLKDIGCKNTMMLIDACREAVTGAKGTAAIGDDSSVLISQAGMVAFFSCDPRERSYEIDPLGHGSFTFCLLQAIREAAISTAAELDFYMKEKVPKINKKYQKPLQRPYSIIIPPSLGAILLKPLKPGGLAEKFGDLTNCLTDLMSDGKINGDDWVNAIAFLGEIEGKIRLDANETTKVAAIKALCDGTWAPEIFRRTWKNIEGRRLAAPQFRSDLPSLD